MDHIAIMKKSMGFIPKILSGEKKIESRWYTTRRSPWGKVVKGDTVFFKNSGGLVNVSTKVSNVISFENLNQKKVKEILKKYGTKIGIEKKDIPKFYTTYKDKKYCILIFLTNVTKVKPLDINKKGFGMQSAWITVSYIVKIIKQGT